MGRVKLLFIIHRVEDVTEFVRLKHVRERGAHAPRTTWRPRSISAPRKWRKPNRQLARIAAQLESANQELESFQLLCVPRPACAAPRDRRLFARRCSKTTAITSRGGQDLLARMRRQAQRMARLIEDLLEFSRLGREGARRGTGRPSRPRAGGRPGARASQCGPEGGGDRCATPAAMGDRGLLRRSSRISSATRSSLPASARMHGVEIGSRTKAASGLLRERQRRGLRHTVREQAVRGVSAPAPSRRVRGHRGGLALVQRIIRPPRGTRLGRSPCERGATFHFTLP